MNNSMPVLRTATGKEYICNFMGVADGMVLYVQLLIDLQEALNVFTNPEETASLSWIGMDNEPVEVEEGFTQFGGFFITADQCPVRVRMLKKLEVNVDAT